MLSLDGGGGGEREIAPFALPHEERGVVFLISRISPSWIRPYGTSISHKPLQRKNVSKSG